MPLIRHTSEDRTWRAAIVCRAGAICSVVLLAILPSLVPASSFAHPVSVTRAYVYVTREQATAKIEVFLEDLFLFHNLKPSDRDFLEPDVIDQGIELHKQFIAARFLIHDAAGNTLPGRIVNVDRSSLPGDGVPLAKLMAYRLTFELQYEFDAPPAFLTFTQQFTDSEGILPSEMKFALQQDGAPDPHTAELRPDDVEIVRLNWNLPPLSEEASIAQRDAWEQQRKEDALGITSYSSVYSFLYINDREVRHEILIPLLTLEESILLARDEDEQLDLDEQSAARAQIEAYFTSGNPIEVDGKRITPIVERCDFYGLDFRDFAQRAPAKPVPLASARVGIILSYPIQEVPQTVKLTWNRFNNYVYAVSTVVFAYDVTSKQTLTRLGGRNVFEWTNPGRPVRDPIQSVPATQPRRATVALPVISLGVLIAAPVVILLLGASRSRRLTALAVLVAVAAVCWPLARWSIASPFAPKPSLAEERRSDIFASLHKNMYRAFEFRTEDEVYDALAQSIDGELLQEVYLEVQRGLEMEEQGGAKSRIKQVEILEGQAEPVAATAAAAASGEGFSYRCRWNVAGTVEHWGHIHERTNQYQALFTIRRVADHWKITQLDVLDERRVQFQTSLRGM